MLTYFKNAAHNSKPAQESLKQRSLDPIKLAIGYDTAQFHHGQRRDEALINKLRCSWIISPVGRKQQEAR